MSTALDVARYFIHLASPAEDEDADRLCPMRLQKLLYYAQGLHLAAAGVPLFADRIEAWQYGPVVRSLYPQFKPYSKGVIPPAEGCEPAGLSPRDRAFVRSVWDQYKGYSATALSRMTHREAPWVAARGGLPPDAPSDAEITPESLRAFFLPRYAERLKAADSRIDPVKWRAAADDVAAGRVRTVEEVRRDLRDRRDPVGRG